jgi:hypothetical protein
LHRAIRATGNMLVAEVRIDDQLLRSYDFVIGRELRGWRTYRIHKSHEHEHVSADSVREELHVDITQFLENFVLLLVKRIIITEIGFSVPDTHP